MSRSVELQSLTLASTKAACDSLAAHLPMSDAQDKRMTALYQSLLELQAEVVFGLVKPAKQHAFIAAGNRPEDGAGVSGLPAALTTRPVHAELKQGYCGGECHADCGNLKCPSEQEPTLIECPVCRNQFHPAAWDDATVDVYGSHSYCVAEGLRLGDPNIVHVCPDCGWHAPADELKKHNA